MEQATGYSREDLRPVLALLLAVHEEAAPALSSPSEEWGRFGALRHKFAQSRFLGVLRVPPFTPHAGGALYSPLHSELVRAPTSAASPLAHPALH